MEILNVSTKEEKTMKMMASMIVADVFEKYGRDAALAVGGALSVANDKWDEEDTKKYGEIARDTLPQLFLKVWK